MTIPLLSHSHYILTLISVELNHGTDALGPEPTVESAVEHAKRAFALKKFEQAVEHYATALELM